MPVVSFATKHYLGGGGGPPSASTFVNSALLQNVAHGAHDIQFATAVVLPLNLETYLLTICGTPQTKLQLVTFLHEITSG
jgi:hypothetical protein